MVPHREFSKNAYRRTLAPSVIFAFLLFGISMYWLIIGVQKPLFLQRRTGILFFLGLTGGFYGTIAAFLSYRNYRRGSRKRDWFNVLIVGISLGLSASLFPSELIFIVYLLFVLNTIGFGLTISRSKIYVVVLLALIIQIHAYQTDQQFHNQVAWMQLFSFPLVGLIVAETIMRLQDTIEQHMGRLSSINLISRKLSSSLDEDEIHTWVKESIQDLLDADTYYLALVNGDNLDLGLFFDDGEYFQAVQVPIEGTLGGWVIRNNQTLFLNDLRVEPELEGVQTRIIGKEKSSLSWLGVPINTEYVNGMIGIASYTPLAFTQDDVELLESLAQQASLALNNARQHKMVRQQARTDSLTGVYNHGYFLEVLTRNLKEAGETKTPLSVIMLDVDYFKKYNDTYGHLVGDEVLCLMVKTIQRFIKNTDAIGRWGGEEFAIALPNTDLVEAGRVACRIQDTLRKAQISVLDERNIPVPTISQGIAEFPAEAIEVFKLIDLADQRLYVAKERGRNQIEPSLTDWIC